MDAATIQRLNHINQQFYTVTATEFDATRGKPWPGWAQLLPYLGTSGDAPLQVLDVGCGNGRFGVYLAGNVMRPIAYTGVDNNPTLLEFAQAALEPYSGLSARLEACDIVTASDDSLKVMFAENAFDLIGVFGLVHHLPGYAQRQAFMQKMARLLAPGGLLAIACWRFYDYERFRERIAPWPDDLKDQVEAHDYLLDWRRGEHALRYCHHVDDAEFAALVQASGLSLDKQYRADGFSDGVNLYGLLRREL